jgi:regulatory protein
MLARREHSSLEVYHKLLTKGFSEEDASEAVSLLVGQDVVSDTRFAEVYTRVRVDRGFGPVKIRAELREKGVDRDLADNAIKTYDEEWLNLAENARIKRFGEGIPKEAKDQAKQMRFLQARGFMHDHIRAALRTND